MDAPLHGHSYSVSSVAFQPNNPQCLVSCSWDRTIRFWTLGTEPKILKVPEQDVIWDRIINFLNLGAESKIFKRRQKEVIAITWINNTSFVLVCSDGTLEVRVCDDYTNLNKSLGSWSVSQEISTVAFFGGGEQKKIAVGNSDGSIWIWDLNFQNMKNRNNSQEIPLEKKPFLILEINRKRKINSLEFSSDGQFLAAGLEYDPEYLETVVNSQQTIEIWEQDQTQQYKKIALPPELKLPNEPVSCVVFKPSCSNYEPILAIAYKLKTAEMHLCLCNLKSGLSEPPLKHKKIYADAPTILAFSPDGKKLVSGSDQRDISLWEKIMNQPESWKYKAISPHSESQPRLNFWITALTFRDDRWVVSGRYDGSIELWELKKKNFLNDHPNTSENDPFVLQGHKEKITALAFSPDKKQLASASFDNTVRVWTIDTEELAKELKKKLYRCLTKQEKEKFLG